MNIPLAAIGFISILGQVVLLRELNVSFYGIELIYLLALGIWLFWTAVGALIGRRNYSPSPHQIAVLFILYGIIIPPDIVFIRSSRLIFGDVPGAYLTFFQQLTVAVISMFPAGLLSGLLFQWAAKAYVTGGRTLAKAYAIESAGGLIGGLFSTLFIMWGLRNFSAAFLCALLSILIPLIVFKELRATALRGLAIFLICIFLFFLWKADFLDYRMTAWNHPHLMQSKDSPYGRITITKLYNQITVFENDAITFETEGIEAEYFCHLAALQHPNPQNILILGGGIEGIVGEMSKYSPGHIDYVELNSVMLNLVTPYLPDDIRNSLNQPNVRVIYADPRQYLKKSDKYDMILVGMPEPSSGQANRFYTREFFQQCLAKLNPGGILGFRLRTAENLWTVPLTARNSSIYNALQSVFPHVLFLPGTTNIVTASLMELPIAPEIMSRRLLDKKIETRLISPNYIQYLFTNDRFMAIKNLLQQEKSPLNTDIRPVCYQYTFIIWLSKFFPRIALVDPSLMANKVLLKPPLSLLLWTSLPVLFLLSRLWPAIRRSLLVGAAGFMGMVLETILILYYQVKYGVLYQDIGLLLTSFMAGLALGALLINKAVHRSDGNQKVSRWYGIGLLTGFCLLCVVIQMIVIEGISIDLFLILCLLATAGFSVAGIFSYVSLHGIDDQKKIVSPLYFADLMGGCLGSLLSSLILIPLLGIDITLWGTLLMAGFTLLLV